MTTKAKPKRATATWLSLKPILIDIALVAAVTVLMFGDVFLKRPQEVLSSPNLDLQVHLLPWRHFGFEQLRQGEFPLWNPFTYSGMPYFGEIQSAVLYPFNLLLYVGLPIHQAVNVDIALHIFLSGVFTLLWLGYQGISRPARLAAALVVMFSGAHFLHVIPGHLPNLSTMAWAPLVLLAVDLVLDGRYFQGFGVAVTAISFMILAGHPQYWFYTFLVAGVYGALRLRGIQRKFTKIFVWLWSVLTALTLCSVQLLPGLEAISASARVSGGTQLAGSFSLVPENLVTLVVPGFFGDSVNFPYWGRNYVWECNGFIGATALLLVIYSSIFVPRGERKYSVSLMIGLVILAISPEIPGISQIMALPGLSWFRGSAKLLFFAVLQAARLVGLGIDHFAASGWRSPNRITALSLVIAACCLTLAGSMRAAGTKIGETTWFESLLLTIMGSGDTFFKVESWALNNFLREASGNAVAQAVHSALRFGFVALLFQACARVPHRRILLVGFLSVELFIFARSLRPSFPVESLARPELEELLARDPGDYRIMDLDYLDVGLVVHQSSIWGFDPLVSKRYAEFMALTQAAEPAAAGQHITFREYHALYKMLRCRYWLHREAGELESTVVAGTLPRFLLVGCYEVIQGRDAILTKLASPQFEPITTVILEEEPGIPWNSDEIDGSVKLLSSNFNGYQLEVQLEESAILLITDPYVKGWRVETTTSAQTSYKVVPANYILQAIPLGQGRHNLHVYYYPSTLTVGIVLSIIGMLMVLGSGAALRSRCCTVRESQDSAWKEISCSK